MRLLRLRSFAATASLAATLFAPTAHAIWPPTADMTAEDLSRSENWPNDPGYAYTERGGGQWYWWSWVPQATRAVAGFRAQEIPLGVGNNVDRAWGITIGDPRVMIAVLDSGINWENDDLINKVALNTAELPMPMGATTHDANGDGVVTVADYLQDTRITCGVAGMPRNQFACRGADGMPNDPNGNGVLDGGDLIRTFSDSTDADNNGYVDDIAGWDFFHDDNDPADDTRFGHGTGEARDSTAEANNGRGGAGGCPRCLFIPTRVGDSFITDVTDFGQAVVYAVDRGASVVQEALGTLNQSRFAQAAIDYAYNHNVVIIASAADENSRHHNMPGTANHTVYTHAIRYDSENVNSATTFLNFNNCTNYGAQLVLSVGAISCSSAAVGLSSGMAGLIYSAALSRNLSPALSAEEVKQLLTMTTDDVNVPESQPTHPMFDRTKYPSLPGWDQRFGYGRTNARRSLEWVRDGKIPPEVDITSPRWFTVFDPDRPAQQTLRIEGRIAARRAPRFDYTIEYAPGVEPADTAWVMVRRETNVTAAVTDRLADIDLRTLTINNPGEVENRYTLTVRIRVTAHYDAPVGDVPGEVRRAFYVHRDPTVMPGFPIDLGSGGESSPHLVDLNGDGSREIIFATSDGEVHAFRADGTDLPGWPAFTRLAQGYDPTRTPSYLGSRAFQPVAGGRPPMDPAVVREAVMATPAIGDLDGDMRPEVVVGTYAGTIHVFRADGTPYGRGFPYTLPDVPSSATSPRAIQARGMFGDPVLADLDGDMRPEIVFGAFDGKVYALDSMTGMVKSGFPVVVTFPEPNTARNRVFGSVGIGDMDGDRRPDIVSVSSEGLNGDNNLGAVYVIYGDGNNHAGGPFHPNWPIPYLSFNFFPLVGEGVSSSPAIADLDGDGRDELALVGTGNAVVTLARGVQPPHVARPSPQSLATVVPVRTAMRGRLTNVETSQVSFIPAFSLGSFGDMTNDGVPDYVITGASLNLAINLAGGGRAFPIEHLAAAFNGRDGNSLPGFPRLIEDYTFFFNPSIADVGGDAYPEVIIGTGGYYLHAFDGCGREPETWPKFTGQWIIANPAVGDLRGMGQQQLVSGTRSGFLWAWTTPTQAATASVQWPTHRHDQANTGNWGTALNQGVRRVPNLAALECPLPPEPDAGTPTDDAGAVSDAAVVADAGAPPADAGSPTVGGDGCGCRTAPASAPRAGLLAIGLAMLAVRRRRRAA
ncbi:MAG: S8 family serine peptidase [Deltaproteobacteria bacterium]|nr:S8 family serine peptidase [Deltaproteobacteria bacterium]